MRGSLRNSKSHPERRTIAEHFCSDNSQPFMIKQINKNK